MRATKLTCEEIKERNAAAGRKWRAEHPDYYRHYFQTRRKKHRTALNRLIECYGCEISGEKNVTELCLHHIDPKSKEFSVSHGELCPSWNRIVEEIAKCAIVTRSYHAVIHAVLSGKKIRKDLAIPGFYKFMKKFYPDIEIKVKEK
jgi:hypothetical protein